MAALLPALSLPPPALLHSLTVGVRRCQPSLFGPLSQTISLCLPLSSSWRRATSLPPVAIGSGNFLLRRSLPLMSPVRELRCHYSPAKVSSPSSSSFKRAAATVVLAGTRPPQPSHSNSLRLLHPLYRAPNCSAVSSPSEPIAASVRKQVSLLPLPDRAAVQPSSLRAGAAPPLAPYAPRRR